MGLELAVDVSFGMTHRIEAIGHNRNYRGYGEHPTHLWILVVPGSPYCQIWLDGRSIGCQGATPHKLRCSKMLRRWGSVFFLHNELKFEIKAGVP